MRERIVVIGGGAGGLELVVRLAKKFRRARKTEVVLIDRSPTHIWKPLLHEVATGSLNSYHDEASYQLLARKHRFKFVLGRATAIDTATRMIRLARIQDDSGDEIFPAREIGFDLLAISVGGLSNDFGIAGVAEHSRHLDTRNDAEGFHRSFTAKLHRINSSTAESDALAVVIVGGGATGVELAAEMYNVVERVREFGFDQLSRDSLQVSLLEAAPELLPRLPPRIGQSVQNRLEDIGVRVLTGTRVARVAGDHVVTSEEERIRADMTVWAAGVKAPAWLSECGLPTDPLGRIRVRPDLSVEGMTGIYALGDCCACRMEDGTEVPPRAQAAHQMAAAALYNMVNARQGKPGRAFVYKDFGSLVSLSQYSTVGNLMGNLMRGGTLFVEGWVARMFYLSLYRLHQLAIFGATTTLLIMLGDRIYRATRPVVKLH